MLNVVVCFWFQYPNCPVMLHKTCGGFPFFKIVYVCFPRTSSCYRLSWWNRFCFLQSFYCLYCCFASSGINSYGSEQKLRPLFAECILLLHLKSLRYTVAAIQLYSALHCELFQLYHPGRVLNLYDHVLLLTFLLLKTRRSLWWVSFVSVLKFVGVQRELSILFK